LPRQQASAGSHQETPPVPPGIAAGAARDPGEPLVVRGGLFAHGLAARVGCRIHRCIRSLAVAEAEAGTHSCAGASTGRRTRACHAEGRPGAIPRLAAAPP
jgi:hypothetical protein